MTTFTDLFWSLQGNQALQAKLMSLVWLEISRSGDSGLMSNVFCNALNPAGVCMAVDAFGWRIDVGPGGLEDLVIHSHLQQAR